MTIELSAEDVTLVQEFIEGRLIELKREIIRTDNHAFRDKLRKIELAVEHLLDQLTPRRLSAS